jgi:transposase-like protein
MVRDDALGQALDKPQTQNLSDPAHRQSLGWHQVSRLCEEIDERAKAFLERPTEGDWSYLWVDATYVKVREAGRVVSVVVIVAVGVNTDGRR